MYLQLDNKIGRSEYPFIYDMVHLCRDGGRKVSSTFSPFGGFTKHTSIVSGDHQLLVQRRGRDRVPVGVDL